MKLEFVGKFIFPLKTEGTLNMLLDFDKKLIYIQYCLLIAFLI